MKKFLLVFFAFICVQLLWIGSSFAQEYIFFYADGCEHCQEVEEYFMEHDIEEMYGVASLEVRHNIEYRKEFNSYLDRLNIDHDRASVPFLVIENQEECNYVHGANNIMNFFAAKLGNSLVCEWSGCVDSAACFADEPCEQLSCEEHSLLGEVNWDSVWKKNSFMKKLSFFGIMLPAALADSINPCAFAVILLLLTSILSKEDNRKKALLAWLSFSVAVFISYFAMGVGLYRALSTSISLSVIKWIVVGLWSVVALANFKDYFWYGKWFVMEVPFARRPAMQKVIKKVVSPWGAFVVGFLISLFLLPCTSGPYFTVLWYLASEDQVSRNWAYLYLVVYNLIFVLPMLTITFLVSMGYASAEKLAKYKNEKKKQIHLIVGLLMAILVGYVLVTM